MKRIIAILSVIFIMLCSCTTKREAALDNKASVGMWLTYSEIDTMLTSDKGFYTECEELLKLCNELGFENIYIHIRAHCDSLYKSEFFPLTENALKYDFDIFKYMLDAFHQNGIKVHAWINPYRVLTSSSNVEKLNTESPAYKWLNDENSENDINVLLDKIKNDLQNSSSLMFDGECLSEDAISSLLSAMEIGLSMAKKKQEESKNK